MRSSFKAGRCAALLLLLPMSLASCKSSSHSQSIPPSAQPQLAASQSAAADPVATQDGDRSDETILIVSKALRQAGVLSRPDQCYAYQFDPAPAQPAYEVNVMENHKHPECGGDPQTEPHLLTARVDKKTQAISHDAGDPGNFHALRPR